MREIIKALSDRGCLESKQVGPLYHFTYLDSLIKILDSNVLRAGQEKINGVTQDYISMTRNRFLEKQTQFGFECAIKVDGTYLSNTYKIVPFNYYYQALSPEDKKKYAFDTLGDESEERFLFTKKNRIDTDGEELILGINSIKKYILNILLIKDNILAGLENLPVDLRDIVEEDPIKLQNYLFNKYGFPVDWI